MSDAWRVRRWRNKSPFREKRWLQPATKQGKAGPLSKRSAGLVLAGGITGAETGVGRIPVLLLGGARGLEGGGMFASDDVGLVGGRRKPQVRAACLTAVARGAHVAVVGLAGVGALMDARVERAVGSVGGLGMDGWVGGSLTVGGG